MVDGIVVAVLDELFDEHLGEYLHDTEGFDLSVDLTYLDGLRQVEGAGELILSEGDHHIREIAQGRVDGLFIEMLFPKEIEPDAELQLLASGG